MIPKAKKRARETRITREQRRSGGPNQGHGWAARQARGEGRAKSKAKRTEKKSIARRRARLAKAAAQLRPGKKSNYARKIAFLQRNGGWGFQWPEKPWRKN